MRKRTKIFGWILLGLGLLALVNFVPMLSKTTPGMKEYSLSGMRTHVRPGDLESADRIAARIQEHSAPVTRRLGGQLADDISLIVYPSHKHLHMKTIGLAGLLLPDWYIGNNTRDSVLISSSDNPGPAHSRESIERAAVHEYVHVLTDRHNIGLDYWLKEGFALYLAGQEPSPGETRRALDISLEEFSTTNALRFAEVGGYSVAYMLVEYLEAEYGWEKLLDFLTPGSNFESVCGKSRAVLLEDMKSWMRQGGAGA